MRQLGPAVMYFYFDVLKYGNPQICIKHISQDKFEQFTSNAFTVFTF